MTKEEFAQMLNGREYPLRISRDEEYAAKNDGLVAIYGESDDLCELRGAIHDEEGACGSTTILIGEDGKLLPGIEDDEKEVLEKFGVYTHVLQLRAKGTKVQAHWDRDGYSWVIETDAPHATFDVMEDGEKFCRGIVIDLKDR